MKTKIILVGGFLGAGKTTLMARAARLLSDRSSRVAMITNDQSTNLVDTALLQREGFGVGEVTGGCFCCRFEDMVTVADKLVRDEQPDILLAEPVGSCTDISATVLQPFKKLHADRYQLAPFSALVDPFRLAQVLDATNDSGFSDKVLYIFRKQLQEADMIVINKLDLLSPPEFDALKQKLASQFPRTQVLGVSALTGQGLEEWLRAVTEPMPAGRSIVPVDYDIYADGEAELGWLNAAIRLNSEKMVDWRSVCTRLMKELHGQFELRSAEIAHLKISLTVSGELLVGNLTRNGGRIAWRGTSPVSNTAELIVNARIAIKPQTLRAIVESALQTVMDEGIDLQIETIECFSPSRPTPTHRFESVVTIS